MDGKLLRGNHKEGSEGVWVNPPNRIFTEHRSGWLDKEPDQILKVEGSVRTDLGFLLKPNLKEVDGPRRKLWSLTKVFVKQRTFMWSDPIEKWQKEKVWRDSFMEE